MDIFSNLRIGPLWSVQEKRFLTKEEKNSVRCAIVVKSDFGYSLEFLTKEGIKHIPVSGKMKTTIGFIPNIDNIKILRLERDYDQEIIYRVEF